MGSGFAGVGDFTLRKEPGMSVHHRVPDFCDGHTALLREPPPLWVIDRLDDLRTFEQEVIRTSYPAAAR